MSRARRILYVQYTNPAGYPPLEHSAMILARQGWEVAFAGAGIDTVERLRLPAHPNILVHQLPPGTGRRPVWVRYARWNLGYIHLVDGRSGKLLCRLYPQDKAANASGQRRKLEAIAGGDPQIQPADVTPQKGRAPLLAKLLADYAATGYPTAYVPHHRSPDSPADTPAATTDNFNPTTTLKEDEA